MGRPPHKPTEITRTRVLAYAQVMVPHDAIAKLIGITQKSLEKHYRAELDQGAAEFKAELRGVLYEATIIKKIPAMLIFAAKTRLRDAEPRPVDPPPLPDADKKPRVIEIRGGLPD